MKKMTAKVKTPFPAEQVVNLIATAEYAQEEAYLEGAIKAEAKDSRQGDVVTITINREDPSRGPGGKVKNKTEKSIVTSVWNISTRKCEWTVKVPGMEKLVKIFGTTSVDPDGDGSCYMSETANVDIKVPLIGDIVASGVVADMKSDFLKKGKLVEKKLAK